MNRAGVVWALAALLVGSLAACSSSSSTGGGSSGAGGVTGPSCPAGSMPPMAMAQSASTACNQCLQDKCGSASQCVSTDCASFESCYCACPEADNNCHASCSAQVTMGTCGTCLQSIVTCETQTCLDACLAGFDAGLSSD
jgi:hypothetical protein